MTRTGWQRRDSGFTLLELLIAVAIFAVIGAMAYGGLQRVMDQQQQTTVHAQRLADLQLAYRVMQRDLEQLVARRIRNEFGDDVAAMVGGSGFEGLEFSRGGYANPAGFQRSEVQRVAYVPDQDRLLRRTWRVLDRAQDSEPDEEVLIEDISEFTLRFLTGRDTWLERWPPPDQTPGPVSTDFPRAVEVLVDIEGTGTLRWLFQVPEARVLAPPSAPGTGGEGEDETGATEDTGETGETGGNGEETGAGEG